MLSKRKGIILAGGRGTRLYPITIASSKQLQPIYDKPMIYYSLSVLMLAGIQEIMLISTPVDIPQFQRLLGNGSQFGLKIFYREQPKPEGLPQAFLIAEDFIKSSPCAMILGDNLFYGQGMSGLLQRANFQESGACIFPYHVKNPSEFGVVGFDEFGNVSSLEEKPKNPKSNYAVTGLYFYDENVSQIAATLKPSSRGELEITDLNNVYLEQGLLRTLCLGRGIAWMDTGTHRNMLEASVFVEMIEARQGLKIACLEEIAFRKGWIGEEQIVQQIDFMGCNQYANYLKSMIAPEESPATNIYEDES